MNPDVETRWTREWRLRNIDFLDRSYLTPSDVAFVDRLAAEMKRGQPISHTSVDRLAKLFRKQGERCAGGGFSGGI